MQADKQQIAKLGRLKERADFLRIQQAGRKWVAKGLVLQICENTGHGLRYGITVTKKTSPSAVVRNRIRRRLRAAACDVLAIQGAENTDYVLIGRPDALTRPYDDLKNDLAWCLRRLNPSTGKSA